MNFKDRQQGEIAESIVLELISRGVIDDRKDVVIKVTHGLSTTVRIEFKED